MARSSSTRSPAAVVPPGDVTIARSAAGSPRSASNLDDPTSNWATIRSTVSTRDPGDHTGIDQGLGGEEHVRRPRPGEPGHGVELVLAEPHDEADAGEDLLRPVEVGVGRVPAGGQRRHARADQRRRVGHRPQHGDPVADADSMAAIVTPAAIDSTRVAPAAAASAATATMSGGFTASTADAHSGTRSVMATPGNRPASSARRSG